MRSQWMVLPALVLVTSAGPAADDTPYTTAGSTLAYLDSERPGPASWQTTPGRLNYLRDRAGCGSPCVSRGMIPGPERQRLERDYIDALNLVTYGDMDVKFTGDRVKLKVRF